MNNGKLVTITGGTQGIGSEIAKYFLKKNWIVLIGARKKKELALHKHKNLHFFKIDVTKEEDHKKFYKKAKKISNNFICSIHSAGFSSWKPIEEVSENFWNKMINTNLKGTFLGCKLSSSYLNKGGSIINISSLAGKRGSENNSVYCASKFGVNGLTQSLAKELGKKQIRVNAVCPVYVNTIGLTQALSNPQSPTKGKNINKFLEDFSKSNASLEKLPTGEDVAKLCFFLASSNADSITGQCINVDCGVMPQ